ncbi:hypothetical protein [Mycolicibacterium tokaiense]|uniref:Transmembrane protein n=1 Tax=Mycolicibacterium tokaiense TaxID=39695 RepID=A0A378TKE7_9MYCO|nr:hypothetical protein [Mycolicibacterium tokaiense]BBY90328.1 hypothetical protein MTOK_61100 [Mycolicibacterium tokaiense]STZ61282.1 Uncharacterised protein [Mycolicibacterium tokaiense]
MGESAQYAPGQHEPALVTIGDITISEHWVITPSGPHPIRGTVWTVTDMSQWHEGISTVGVILCIIFFVFCLLGLLFLLLKDQKLSGFVQVTVQGSGFYHQTLVPVRGTHTFMLVNQSVNLARSLAARA